MDDIGNMKIPSSPLCDGVSTQGCSDTFMGLEDPRMLVETRLQDETGIDYFKNTP
jgi:hypothetical protein